MGSSAFVRSKKALRGNIRGMTGSEAEDQMLIADYAKRKDAKKKHHGANENRGTKR